MKIYTVNMKVLHLSYHFGCASDLNYIFKSLGHDITYFEATCWPYTITEDIAHKIWEEKKDFFQSFDLIITSDTVALSLPLLLHFEELKPRLIIWICNRFNVAMENVPLLADTLKRFVDRVPMIPYIEFESVWCSQFGIQLKHDVINPLGRHIEKYICNPTIMERIFKPLDRSRQTKEDAETFFVPDYHNNRSLPDLLAKHGISCVFGRYMDISEIKPYKAVVSLPDAFGKIFYHEAIQQDIAVYIPSPSFIKELVKNPGYGFTTKQYVNPDIVPHFCEYYKFDGCYVHYDSFEDLIDKIKNSDTYLQNVHTKMIETRDRIHDEILEKWQKIITTTN